MLLAFVMFLKEVTNAIRDVPMFIPEGIKSGGSSGVNSDTDVHEAYE